MLGHQRVHQVVPIAATSDLWAPGNRALALTPVAVVTGISCDQLSFSVRRQVRRCHAQTRTEAKTTLGTGAPTGGGGGGGGLGWWGVVGGVLAAHLARASPEPHLGAQTPGGPGVCWPLGAHGRTDVPGTLFKKIYFWTLVFVCAI